MSLNPTGSTSYSWNYTKPDQPYYTQTLIGTVVAIQEVQKRAFTRTGQPELRTDVLSRSHSSLHPRSSVRKTLVCIWHFGI